jgi:hypothetical protein
VNIADLFLRILADDTEFAADLVKKAGAAGDTAGATLGQRMGNAVKQNGAKIIAGVLAAGVGIAVKGLLELQNITADFRAETGATADEADRAGKAINAMSGRNIQPVAEIGKALTKVWTDLHVVGDEAVKLTQKFLTFGRVTKRDAAEEVASFHEILDAWNLTADHTGEIMDALVLSHQRFGGVIANDQAALIALAPALLAANETWRDGLALINMFKSAGVDAADAAGAMTKALHKVTSPEELKALVADITATVDPFQRAQKAIDLFGAKAGAKLANVLRPGIAGLEDYTISATDATGATQQAADVLDSTWGARFELLIKRAGSAIIGFGNDWAGAAQVAGTAAAAFGALGGGKLVAPLIGGLKGAWAKVASSSVVMGAVKVAAGKAATVYIAALIAGDVIGRALSKAWMATGAKVLAMAGIQGAAAGTAYATAAAAAAIAIPLTIVALIVRGDTAPGAPDAAVSTAKYIETLRKMLSQGRATEMVSSTENVAQALHRLTGEVVGLGTASSQGAPAIKSSLSSITTSAVVLGERGGRSFTSLVDKGLNMKRRLAEDATTIANALKALTATLLGEATALINGYYDPIIAQDELRVAKDTVAADTIARNATKAGSAERHQADLTLANSQKNLDQTRANLLAAGTLSAKDQKAWLADLQKRYKTATGSARTEIGLLIAKIKELQHLSGAHVNITTDYRIGGRATGGPVKAGVPYWVNENTPRSEIWVPDVSGKVLSGAVPVTAAPAGGTTYNIPVTVAALPEARDPLAIARGLGRYARSGLLTPEPPG